MSELDKFSTEQLIREIVKRAGGENVVEVIDMKNRSAWGYHGKCADEMRDAVSTCRSKERR